MRMQQQILYLNTLSLIGMLLYFFVHASHSLIDVIMLLGTIRGREITARGPYQHRQGFLSGPRSPFLNCKTNVWRSWCGATSIQRIRSREAELLTARKVTTSFSGNITRAPTLATVTSQLHLPNIGTRGFKNSAMWPSVEKVWRTLGTINLFVTSCHYRMIF